MLLKGLESKLRIRTALTISHEKFRNQSKANQWPTEEILDAQNMVSGTCFFSCRGLEQRHSRLWARRVKTTQETITFADKRKSLLVIQIQEALWRKLNNLKPYLAATKRVKFASEGQSCRPKITVFGNRGQSNRSCRYALEGD